MSMCNIKDHCFHYCTCVQYVKYTYFRGHFQKIVWTNREIRVGNGVMMKLKHVTCPYDIVESIMLYNGHASITKKKFIAGNEHSWSF